MSAAFLTAAASYFGLGETHINHKQIYTNDAGRFMVVFEIPLTDEDMEGIMGRMKAMQQTAPARQQTNGTPIPTRTVTHVDAPEDDEPVSMDAVWLLAKDVSEQQKLLASDARWNEDEEMDEFLLRTMMLTDEQKAKASEVKS